jgi:polyisoprenoid-binding protein YceI
MTRFTLALIAGLLSGSVLGATWTVDREHSRIGFTSTWEGVAYDGEFHRYQVVVEFDPDNLSAGSFGATVDVTSVDTRNADRDAGMAEPEFLDFDGYPTATFRSTAVRSLGDNRYEVDGVLTIKDIDRKVTVPFTWTRNGRGAVLDGSARVNRLDFGIGTGEWADAEAVGLEVTIMVHLALTET